MKYVGLLLLIFLMPQQDENERAFFLDMQLAYPRVQEAFQQKDNLVRTMLSEKKIDFENFKMYLRYFKQDSLLEVWGKNPLDDQYQLVTNYKASNSSGAMGPKRIQGDRQIPEGFYTIDKFNPKSNFHLSMRVSYPNDRDRMLAQGKDPGGDIYIHGGSSTMGCIPVTDDKIKELFWMIAKSYNQGHDIPVHIYPFPLNDEHINLLYPMFAENPELTTFWEMLRPGYEFFEKYKVPPHVSVEPNGAYKIWQ